MQLRNLLVKAIYTLDAEMVYGYPYDELSEEMFNLVADMKIESDRHRCLFDAYTWLAFYELKHPKHPDKDGKATNPADFTRFFGACVLIYWCLNASYDKLREVIISEKLCVRSPVDSQGCYTYDNADYSWTPGMLMELQNAGCYNKIVDAIKANLCSYTGTNNAATIFVSTVEEYFKELIGANPS